ncbi:polyketide synthase [Mycobacterium kyorinense]|uniref:Polyketide synthase n=1 Tax=Mycobacterium kyorinense TaxID=487514 RepID=A0A1A2YUP3_9MYCO|nr:type I polyketide synthase [Mycobacterium kyorinense]OBI41720.1 polyketide synthase [Mycobacterium kyorinense]
MTEATVTPVAVIGMACRLPGGINSPDELWERLLRGDDLVTEIPADHWDVDEFYDPEPGVPGKSVTRCGGFLDDIWGFDAPFFGLRTHEATYMDPNHRLLLETSWEAIEHAGRDPRSLFGSKTGVFMGIVHDDHVVLTYESGAIHDAYAYPGNTPSLASGRIAYWLGVHGPAMTLDTACSTGLLTLHLACRSLHDGESDLALAGGVNTLISGIMNAAGSALGMYSPTGRCHSFDVAADGFVRAEGCAVVLLKRLPDALRDGDRILAVVRGTAANHDGRTKTISRPSLNAQAMAYRAALTAAGVDGATVGMVEAHGTGTRVGDPIEFGSLAQVYGLDGAPCALGSAKSNFGHSEAAAGALGLIKTTLALQHGVVPPSLHFTRLPDVLAQIETGLFVPTAATPWPSRQDQERRRAAVSSYGLSGTNVHAVLEEAPDVAPHDEVSPAGPLVYALSATSTEALRRTSARLAEWISARADQLVAADLAYTLARRRGHRPVRAAVVAASLAELTTRLHEVADSDIPYPAAAGQDDRGPVWVFSGQGSQWAAMGAALLAAEPVFAATVAEAEPLIAAESGFSVTQAMSAPETVTGIDRVQPTLFTMQVALAAAMRAYGVSPGAVVGHSLGEAAAAVVAGALSLEDGVRVVCRRSRLLSTIAGAGAMASVELPARRVRDELAARNLSDVVVSVITSPESTVIGGTTQTVRELVALWESRDIMAREVAVDVASHSPQVDPILSELADALAELTPVAPSVPFYSATLDDPREQRGLDASYWVTNLRHPVRFADAVQAALEDGHRVFAELSPHPLLTRAVEQTAHAADVSAQALACMWREQELPHGLREFLANLHCAGAAVDFAALYPTGRLVDAPLPTWTHRRLYIGAAGTNRQVHGARTITVHPLLGSHVRLPEEAERHVWQGEVGTAALPWLGDHQVHGVPALPGAAYCEMALSAAHTVLGEQSEVHDIRFEQMLQLDKQTPITAVASAAAPGVVEFDVVTDHDGERTRRAVAVLCADEVEPQPHPQDISALLAAHPRRTEGDELRQRFDAHGVNLGPAFAALIAAHTADDGSTLVTELALPKQLRAQRGAYRVHPVLLDACFQSVGAHRAINGDDDGGLLLPLSVRRLRVCDPARNPRYCLVRLHRGDGSDVEADLDVLDETGAPVLIIRGFRLGSSATAVSDADRLLAERLLAVEWRQSEPPASRDSDPGQWLLIPTSDTDDSLTTRLVDAMKASGAQCDWLEWPQRADHAGCADQLNARLRASAVTGLVVVLPPPAGTSDEAGLATAREHVGHLIRIARELTESPGEPPRLYVLTRRAQAVHPADRVNLDQAGLRGLVRVIGAEHSQLRPTQIDVDDDCDPEKLALELLSGSAEDETAWRDGQWYVARLRPAPLRPDERRTTTVHHERDGMRLGIRTPGDLQTMEFAAVDRVAPGRGEIEVAVTASSINFADVLVAFGQYPSLEGRLPQPGTDFAGVVTAVGPDVTNHRVGDHVGGFSKNGCWGTFVTCDARVAAPLPPGLTDEVAAATTTGHATAWYGLHDQARISAGDRVLIHSATGGVGQAAIAIARAAGAEIFATAGSPQRRKMLQDMGIEHVYDSRSTDFADLIRRDTDGYGVDIVLNSLTGAAQRAGFELLAVDGRFVEIGKRDVYANNRLGMYPFRRNLTFHYVDLALMVESRPQRVGDLLRQVYRLVADGELPPPESTHYPLAEAATAIRVMSAAEHSGKLVLDVPRSGHSTAVVPPEQARIYRPDGAYIITGGLGGLGLFLAAEMAAAGCGRIVLTSRSQPNAQAEKAIASIRATGADVHVECGDIAEPATAGRLVAAATATGLPLRGVLHAAAVVEDATLTTITDDLIERDWVAKVYGAWHLHQATAGQPLDWFCCFSSAAALLGSPGQGAYAAANSWLDAFTHWRREQRLPATTIAWGAWAEIGRAASLEEGRTTMIAPDEGAHAFQTLLRYDRTYTGYMPTAGTPLFSMLVARSPFAEAFKTAGSAQQHDTAAVRTELLTLPPDEWPTRLRRLVTEQASLILRRTVDPDHSFADHGLDSLGFLELRSRIEAETGIRLTPKAIATHNTARTLARHLADTLMAEQATAVAS